MRKRLGQHFLFDPNILKKIVRVSGVTADDTVIEIGPGAGTLTKHLAAQAKKVIAIEIDRKLAAQLNGRIAGADNVDIISADALRFPYDTISGSFRVVSNLPYYITTPLI
ncbi:MAG: methyltransferase domain-containing protein, partial [Nitrospiraceae bacterium]